MRRLASFSSGVSSSRSSAASNPVHLTPTGLTQKTGVVFKITNDFKALIAHVKEYLHS
jgi:hypothetical protein